VVLGKGKGARKAWVRRGRRRRRRRGERMAGVVVMLVLKKGSSRCPPLAYWYWSWPVFCVCLCVHKMRRNTASRRTCYVSRSATRGRRVVCVCVCVLAV
jgi:hypothetical protein